MKKFIQYQAEVLIPLSENDPVYEATGKVMLLFDNKLDMEEKLLNFIAKKEQCSKEYITNVFYKIMEDI